MTTIQISKKTQERLIRVISDYQKKIGRRINYDEIIEIILNQIESDNLAMKKFNEDFGLLKGKTGKVFDELGKLKSEGNEKLEEFTK